MRAMLIVEGRCPVCGYASRGVQAGTARPGMRGLTVAAGSIVLVPPSCQECGHPLALELYDRAVPDERTQAAYRAWRGRQQARQRARRKGAAR